MSWRQRMTAPTRWRGYCGGATLGLVEDGQDREKRVPRPLERLLSG